MTMPVSFERIPSNIRVPLFYAEISNREASYLQTLQPALLIGPMLPSGAAIPLEPVLVRDAGDAVGLFGAGSILADMVGAYRRNDTYGTIWAIPHVDATAATAAKIVMVIDGVATAPGTIGVYVAGDRYRVTVANGDGGLIVATRLAAAITADPFALVTAVGAQDPDTLTAGRVTLTSKNKGAVTNDIKVVLNYRGLAGGESTPAGLDIEMGDSSLDAPGAGLADLAPVTAAMGDDEYDFISMPYTDNAALDALAEALDDVTGRWAWSRQIYGHAFCARMGTFAQLQTFGATRNDPHVSVLGFAVSPTVSWRRAAALCAQAATSLRIDPARPLQTLPLVGALAPRRGDRLGMSQRNTLLYSGVATEMESGGAVAIERCVTTYQKNVWNQPDPSYLDVQTLATLTYIVRFLRIRILQKFPRHKLANDGTPFGLGQAIVTPRIIRAELIAAYSELIEQGICENMEAFKQFLVVERDPNDPNRVNVLLPPDLVNQLRIFAMLVEFRLRYAASATAAAA
jgi:phage tail sheath gpL-like